MATNNAVNVVLSGASGTGNFAGTTSPTFVTPALGTPASGVITNCTGSPTLTQVTFSPTTGGIVGTTTNDNAGAGKVGEFVSSTITAGSPVVFTANVVHDLTSISLTAGDWDIFGNITCSGTTVTQGIVWISKTSATLPSGELYNVVLPSATGTTCGLPAPYFRASNSGTVTVYISGAMNGTGTLNCSGGIYARRVR